MDRNYIKVWKQRCFHTLSFSNDYSFSKNNKSFTCHIEKNPCICVVIYHLNLQKFKIMKSKIIKSAFFFVLFSLIFTSMYGQRVIKNSIYSETWLADNYRKVTYHTASNEIGSIQDVESNGQLVQYLFHQDKAIEKVYLKNATQPFKNDKQYINIEGLDYEIISSSVQVNADLNKEQKRQFIEFDGVVYEVDQKRNDQSKEYMDFEGKTYEVIRRE